MWVQRATLFRHIKALRQSFNSPWMILVSSSYSDTRHKKAKLAPVQERKMIGRFRLYAKGGSGGSGGLSCSSLRSSCDDHYGKPDGGNGGKGGDVILECSPTAWDFSGLQPHLIAQRGGNGSSKNKHGTRGADKVAKVPIGTVMTVIHLIKGEIPFVPEICRDLDPWELPGAPIDDVTGSDQQSDPSGPNMAVDSGGSSSSRPKKIVDELAHDMMNHHQPHLRFAQKMRQRKKEEIQYNVAELTVRGQRLVIARGAKGGRGSWSLQLRKNDTHTRDQQKIC